jgi:pimeloyl-ACP methyl ester carboxylesterase
MAAAAMLASAALIAAPATRAGAHPVRRARDVHRAPRRGGVADPRFTVPNSALRRSVWCDPSVTPSSGREAVLLVHGTGGAPQGYWDWNYELALPHAGFGVCTVTVPGRETGDVTYSAQYVAYAARYAHRRSGRKIALIGHSQGGTLAVWVAKFWPGVAAQADDVISMSGDLNGTELASIDCAVPLCPAVSWQLRTGSHFMHALQSAPMPAGPTVTSIYSDTDEVVWPEPTASTLPGAANIGLQTLCPGRIVDHATMLADAVGYALVLDALTHPGPAVPGRIANRPSSCRNLFMPYINPLKAVRVISTIEAFFLHVLVTEPKLTDEPALPAYAAAYGD